MFIDVDIDHHDGIVPLPSPAYQGLPQVKGEAGLTFENDLMPQLSDPRPQTITPAVSSHDVGSPQDPVVVFSYFEPTEISVGPARAVILPPCACQDPSRTPEENIKGQLQNNEWKNRLKGLPGSVFGSSKRAHSKSQFSDVLAEIRNKVTGKGGVPLSRKLPASSKRNQSLLVKSSAEIGCFSVHKLMQCMVDASFTMDDAAEDFMYLSLFRLEIAQGVYTTPPQLVLSLRRRIDLLTSSKDTARGMQILHRLDSVWRTWRLCWITRPFGNCRIGIEGMADRDEAHRLRTTDAQKLLTDRFLYGAGDIEDEEDDIPAGGDGKLRITQAAELCLQSPEAYPCFIVRSALGSLNLTDRYHVVFKKLTSKLDVGASTSRVVFVRNWAIPFIDVPPRFIVPALTDQKTAEDQIQNKKVTKKAKPTGNSPPPTRGVYWTGNAIEGATKGRKYYQSVISTNGLNFDVGCDVIVNEPAQKKPVSAKSLIDSRTIGRLISLYESTTDHVKHAVIRQWVSPKVAKRKLPKGQKGEDFKDWEMLASNSLKTIPADRLGFLLEVRSAAGSGVLTLPIIIDQPVDDVYENSHTMTDLQPAESDTWQTGTVTGGVPILKLICTRLLSQKNVTYLSAAQPPPPEGSELSGGSKSVVELDFKKPPGRDTPTPVVRKISLRRRNTPTIGVKAEPVKSEATPPPGGSSNKTESATPPPLNFSEIISASGTLPAGTLSLRNRVQPPTVPPATNPPEGNKEKRPSETPGAPRKVIKLRPSTSTT